MRLGDDDDEGGGEGEGDAFNLHLLSLTIMWAGVANLGLIVPLFRQTTVTYYLHTLLMWIVCIFTFVGSYMELMF
jgi:formate-dependent nitrite reductase membrane component NrfD